jgi:signal transduction histidine kinase
MDSDLRHASRINILLVDDRTENLVALESILDAPDYNLVRAQNGQDALLAILAEDFAAIVLDVQMPGMTGIELAQLIRQRRKSQHVPILFLTAHGDDSAIEGYQAGGVDFLTKPIQPAILRSKIAVFADLYRKSAALKAEVEERKAAEERIIRLNSELSDRIEELATANAELEAFSYTVSHDLRAPLRQVSGFLALLQRGLSDRQTEADAEYITLINGAVARMGQLINDLLSFSRVSRTEMEHGNVDLTELVHQVIETMSPALAGRVMRWKIGELPTVEGDTAMLRQVFASLLDNAVKFTRTREVAEVEVGSFQEGDEYVLFVRDNGVGFDTRYTDKLFGVFQRLHTGAEFEGTGIGLASVRRIMSRHNGRCWAESLPGVSTVVYCSIPIPATHELPH